MGRRAGQETKRRGLAARAEGRIIDTDSPDDASTCCVYVPSDNSISQRGPASRKLAGKGMRAANVYVI